MIRVFFFKSTSHDTKVAGTTGVTSVICFVFVVKKIYVVSMRNVIETDTRTTLQDIADHCGLSRSTVARVLNGNAGNFRIAVKTIERVQRTAKMLNYRPNRLARAVANRRTHLIGISVPDFSIEDTEKELDMANGHRIMGLIISTITQHPLFEGYDLVAHPRIEYKNRSFTENDMKRDLLDGMIYSTPSEKHQEFIKAINAEIPLILMGDIPELHNDILCVDINNRKMAQQATEHLLSIGRKNIMVLIPDTVFSTCCIQDRLNGYHDALLAAGLKDNPDLVRIIRSDEKSIAEFIASCHSLESVDALLCLTDSLALFCMEPLRKRGYKIPEDVALMGFGGNNLINKNADQLSTVQTPFHTMAYEAAGKLLEVIEGKTPYTPGLHEVQAELLIRSSTVKG